MELDPVSVSAQSKPVIAITMGDPGGVGPEVLLKALAHPSLSALFHPLIIGDVIHMRKVADAMGFIRSLNSVSREELTSENLRGFQDSIPVFQPYPDGLKFETGELSGVNGRAAYECIITAADLALAGTVDGICTAPIAKEAMYKAGFSFPGHTELLAERCGGLPVRMMLAGGGVRVILQTIHVALSKVSALLNSEEIYHTLSMSHEWGRKYLGKIPRIAVCGLNPHAGEGGHFGDEEIVHILPAINIAVEAGILASGPYPADTVFHRMLEKEFDVIIAMYHDQGLIPVKTLDFHGGVNITVGLPIIRTSPDHGTAFNIAGKFLASESSMVAAISEAVKFAWAK